MASRAKARALELLAKSNERYILMYWEDEDTVSVHKEEELSGQDLGSSEDLKVGDAASCVFKKKLYEGKIAGIGNRSEILKLEQEFLKGKFTPFEQVKEPAVTDNTDVTNCSTICLPSEDATPAPKRPRMAKRKQIHKDFSNKARATKEKTTEKSSDGKKRDNKQKKGMIITIGSGAESDDDSLTESDSDQCNINGNENDIIISNNIPAAIFAEDEPITETRFESSNFEDLDTSEPAYEPEYVEPPCITESWTQTEEVQDSTLLTIQHHYRELSFTLENIQRNQTFILDRLWCIQNSHLPVIQTNAHFSGINSPYVTPPPTTPLMPTFSESSAILTVPNGPPVPSSQRIPTFTESTTITTELNEIPDVATQMLSLSVPATPALTVSPTPVSSALTVPPIPVSSALTVPPTPVSSALTVPPTPMSSTLTVPPTPVSSTLTVPPTPVSSTLTVPPTPVLSALTDVTNTSAVTPIMSPTQSLQSIPPSLPPIDRSQLIPPEEVLQKYPKYLKKDKLTRLAVRLAQESYFGKEIMVLCTVQGNSDLHALPADALRRLKSFLISVTVPRYYPDRIAFETLWKSCSNSIGQSCKNLRS